MVQWNKIMDFLKRVFSVIVFWGLILISLEFAWDVSLTYEMYLRGTDCWPMVLAPCKCWWFPIQVTKHGHRGPCRGGQLEPPPNLETSCCKSACGCDMYPDSKIFDLLYPFPKINCRWANLVILGPLSFLQKFKLVWLLPLI